MKQRFMRVVLCVGFGAAIPSGAWETQLWPEAPKWTSVLWGIVAVFFLYQLTRRRRVHMRLRVSPRPKCSPVFTIDSSDLPEYQGLRIFSEVYVPRKSCTVCGEPIRAFVRYIQAEDASLRHETPADFLPHQRRET